MPADKPSPDANTQDAPVSAWAEFLAFLREHMLWWLLPLVLVLTSIAALAIYSGTGATPFIYTPH